MGEKPWRHEVREMEADSLNQDAEQIHAFPQEVQSPPSSPPSSWAKAGTSWGWTLEILSIVGSVGWMVGVIAILFTMSNRPLADWNFFLSLPATLAIFATAAKLTAAIAVSACISQYKWIHFKKAPQRLVDLDLFDSASRGPLGSLVLLCRRPKGLASLGALVTILALALDVFVQQVIKLDEVDVFTTDGRAELGLTHTYKGTSSLNSIIAASPFTANNIDADISMQGAIYRGVFNLESPPVFRCNASRCTWDEPQVSLGFASTCTDVTEPTIRSANASLWNGLRGSGGNLTTPGGVRLDAKYSPTSFQTVVSVGGTSLLNMTYDPENKSYTVLPGIARVAVFRTEVDRTNHLITLNKSEIIECDLSLAAYRYFNVSASGPRLAVGREEVIRLEPGQAEVSSAGNNNPSSSPVDAVAFSQSGIPVLRASLADMRAITLLLVSSSTGRFTGSIYFGNSSPVPTGMGDAFRRANISQVFGNMAKSMTDQLRSDYSMTAEGVSIDQAVFVHVQWEWLTLPLFVELLSIIFVVVILVKSTRAKNVQLWKSSAVAVLTHGLSFRENMAVATLGANVQTLSELQSMSKTIKVKLG